MNITEFIDKAKQGAVAPVVLFCPGKAPFNKEEFEPYLVERAVMAVIDAIVDPSLRDLSLTTFYADEVSPATVVEEARTMPFLAARRVIVLRNAQVYAAMSGDKRAPLFPFLDYLEHPADFTVLLIIAPEVEKRRRFFKVCQEHVQIIETPQLDDRALGLEIVNAVRQQGHDITTGAVSEIIECAGSRLSDIFNAVNIVCNFVKSDARITEDDVHAACADVAETSTWSLTDAIASSNTAKALEALHDLLACNKSPEDLIGLVNWLLESAYRSCPETRLSLASTFVARKVEPLARKFGPQRLAAAMAMVTRTHFALRSTGADKQLLLEMMVIKLAGSSGRGAPGTRVRRK